jgi:hypothetical protein
MTWIQIGVAAATLFTAVLSTSASWAISWCAQPLIAHEWGVQAFGNDGTPAVGVPVPDHFHTSGPKALVSAPVWELPADSGIRFLPVVQLFGNTPQAPVGLSVGFAQGEATVWYPQVDVRRPAHLANGGQAAKQRGLVEAARTCLTTPGICEVPLPLVEDTTRQLEWQHLALSTKAEPASLAAPQLPWVKALRAVPGAHWVEAGSGERERFVFYEGKTAEKPALELVLGHDRWDGQGLILRNRGTHPVYDVFLVHHQLDGRFVVFVPVIEAGKSVEFVLEDARVSDEAAFKAATRGRMQARLTAPPLSSPELGRDCEMGRIPAIPVEVATDHRVYAEELAVLLDLWAPRFFDSAGTTIVYREDTRYIDAMMPISVFTDMHHHIQLSRLGLAVWEQVKLP